MRQEFFLSRTWASRSTRNCFGGADRQHSLQCYEAQKPLPRLAPRFDISAFNLALATEAWGCFDCLSKLRLPDTADAAEPAARQSFSAVAIARAYVALAYGAAVLAGQT